MPELLRSAMVTARKAHGCRTCNGTAVQPGDTYQRATYIYDGTIYDWVQCGPCADLATEVWAWCLESEEGIGRDEYVEWAREYAADPKLGEDATAYLIRAGLRPSERNSDA